jgi:hypothetical protein
MSSPELLEFSAPSLDLSFKVELLSSENPDVVAQVLRHLPIESVLGHVVISGETVWLPTRIVHLGRSHMVPRTIGAVYFYAPGQTICLTYGQITESARINKFGQVLDADLPKLRRLGERVWDETVSHPRRNLVRTSVRRAA